MHAKAVLRIAVVTALLLIIPLLGNIYVDGWNWGVFDFVFAFVLIFGTGLAFDLIRRQSADVRYQAAVGLGLLSAFALLWINAAVGIIGGEGDIPNLPYFGVLLIGVIGAIVTRLDARGLSRTMFAVALAQFLVPFIAFMFWRPVLHTPPGIVGAFVLNTGFAVLFAGSGLLFWQAARKRA